MKIVSPFLESSSDLCRECRRVSVSLMSISVDSYTQIYSLFYLFFLQTVLQQVYFSVNINI